MRTQRCEHRGANTEVRTQRCEQTPFTGSAAARGVVDVRKLNGDAPAEAAGLVQSRPISFHLVTSSPNLVQSRPQSRPQSQSRRKYSTAHAGKRMQARALRGVRGQRADSGSQGSVLHIGSASHFCWHCHSETRQICDGRGRRSVSRGGRAGEERGAPPASVVWRHAGVCGRALLSCDARAHMRTSL